MKILTFLLVLFLHIACGLTEESHYPLNDELRSSFTCHFIPSDCSSNDECLREVCSYLFEHCQKGTICNEAHKCWVFLPKCIHSNSKNKNVVPSKRSSITKNAFLFMKLHPMLHRVVDPNGIKVPTRYRRIGVRLGSEFLGKRSDFREDQESEWEDTESLTMRRGRRLPGTELLGKRWDLEMLGKRNVELLGKRGAEFLGKRSTEFLGKRSTEFLGKRSTEFLGKRGAEFLGKRASLGNIQRLWMCNEIENCYLRYLTQDPALIMHYHELSSGIEKC